MKNNILSEGMGDQDFVIKLLAKIQKSGIECFPPKALGSTGNGVPNVIRMIPVLVNKILSNDISKAAIIVDADYTGINGGFTLRRQQVTTELAKFGFVIHPFDPSKPPGEIFYHPTLEPMGLYIFPNHSDDGMLEDLLKKMVSEQKQVDLLSHAVQSVANLPHKLFNTTLHTSKAEIGAFLSWQHKPPAYTGVCVDEDIFDANAPSCAPFIQWLNSVF